MRAGILKYGVWAAVCGGLTVMVAAQTHGMLNGQTEQNEMIELVLLNPQKILFNDMLYFAALLYIGGKDLLSVPVALRCGTDSRRLLGLQAVQGVKLIAGFNAMLILFMGLALKVLRIEFCAPPVETALLWLLPCCWYCIYLLVYNAAGKHFTGVIFLILSRLAILVMGLMLDFAGSLDIFALYFSYPYLLAVTAGAFTGAALLLRRKEWL